MRRGEADEEADEEDEEDDEKAQEEDDEKAFFIYSALPLIFRNFQRLIRFAFFWDA